MIKDEYLVRVQSELGFMTSERYNEACAYFESCFDGEQSDDEVMNELGSPKTAARNYYSGLVRSKIAPKGIKRVNIPKGLIIALVMVLLPVLIPTAVGAVVMTFALAGAAVSLIALLPAVSVGMWIVGADIFLRTFTNPVILVDKLVQAGMGLAICGFGLVMTWFIAKWYMKMIPAILKGIIIGAKWLLAKISPEEEEISDEK